MTRRLAKPIALLVLTLGSLAALPALAQERLMTVTGQGMVAAVPDIAYISIGVSQQAGTAAEAMAAMSAGMQAVMAQLAAAGIAPIDIQTGQLMLDPVYDDRSYDGNSLPTVSAYIATTMVDVRVRDLALIGTVLDAAVQDGANRLGGIRFDLADPAPAMEEARRRAVADGQGKAALFAEASGVTLGALVTFTELGQYSDPQPMFNDRMVLEQSGVPIAGGEVTLQATVSMVYAVTE